MHLELEGKVTLVTGGSKGIGLAAAAGFAAAGAKVAIVSRNADNLNSAQEALARDGYDVLPVRADLVDAAAAAEAVATVERRLGPIDVLINSAGAAKRYEPHDLNAEVWRQTLDAKFFTYIHVQDAVLASFRARHERRGENGEPAGPLGAIVNIIGVGGKQPTNTHIAGGSANAALMLSTVGLATHYARIGVRINGINPGFIHTKRVDQSLGLESARQGISKEEALAQGEARVALGRYGEPKEIADVALFLASPRASYIVGAIVTVDGGGAPVI